MFPMLVDLIHVPSVFLYVVTNASLLMFLTPRISLPLMVRFISQQRVGLVAT